MATTATARVLVVHDEPRSLHRIRRLLRRSGYRVSGASNREQALTIVRRSPPVDLVLADLAATGGSLITDIARRSPSSATLFLASRKPARPVPPRAEILWKPFSERRLLRRVQQVLAK